jgi:hypothetical protein
MKRCGTYAQPHRIHILLFNRACSSLCKTLFHVSAKAAAAPSALLTVYLHLSRPHPKPARAIRCFCVLMLLSPPADLAYVICTVFFVDGIVTSLQLTVGDRLPLIHSAAFAYVNPTLALAAHIKATQAFGSEHERFLVST